MRDFDCFSTTVDDPATEPSDVRIEQSPFRLLMARCLELSSAVTSRDGRAPTIGPLSSWFNHGRFSCQSSSRIMWTSQLLTDPWWTVSKDCCRFAMVKVNLLTCIGGTVQTVTGGTLSELQEGIILNIREIGKCTARKVCSWLNKMPYVSFL
jgi:hypothetical protein